MLNPSGLSEMLLLCTVKITVQKSDKTSSGTGFFFEIPTSPNRHLFVLITNKHVIKNGILGEFYIYRANLDGTPNGSFDTFLINDFETAWINHPNPNIDLCAFIVTPDRVHEPSTSLTIWTTTKLDENMILSLDELKRLRTVEEVLMVGYPDGLYDLDSRFPLIRKGITALHPAITYNKSSEKSLGVLDISSFPGSSGSPVFINNYGIYQKKGETIDLNNRLILLGVLSDWFISEPEGKSIFDKGYHLNLGGYIKGSELLILSKEVKKVHILQVNPVITELVETQLEPVKILAGDSPNSAILQVYNDVIVEIKNYIVFSTNAAQTDSLPPLHTVINEINYLINENLLTDIILEDFDELLTYRNLAIDNSEQTNNFNAWQLALQAAKRIVISFRLLVHN